MLAIRLFRVGRKNQAAFKIVVTDKRNAASRGRFVEEVGFYNPLTKQRNLKGDRVKYWMSVGAKPSDTVYNMLITDGVIEGEKIPKHKASKKEQAEPETAAPAAETPTSAEETPTEPVEEEKPTKTEAETPVEEKKEETPEQAPTEEPKTEENKPETTPDVPAKEEKEPKKDEGKPASSAVEPA